MNGAYLLIGVSACFLLGYRFFAKWIERKLGIDPSRPTPAVVKNDGCDYVPAHPTVLFGHHFAAIAGAGPIVGPVLAAEFGWVPVVCWILFGCIFIGAMHDMIALFLSVRHEGQSIGAVIGTILGKPGRIMALLFSWSALILLVAEFCRQIAGTFVVDPAIATASLLFIGEAVLFGFCIYRWHMSVLVASLIFVPVMFAFVWVGNLIPLDLQALFGCSVETTRTIWTIVLIAYCFVASTCPVQFLLQPRDYLNAYLLYVMMALGFLGVFVAHPVLHLDAFAGFSVVGRAGSSDLLFPFLFITVACGACSGFHALVASGTSSKQVSNERSIRPIAYGGMLLEGVLATIGLIGVAGTYLSQKDYVSAIQGMEPVQMFASTIAGFCVKLFTSIGMDAEFGKHIAESFMLLSVSAFLMTSVDAGTRLSRFSWQELMPKKNPVLQNRFLATFFICVIVAALLLVNPQVAKQLWTLFGSANQLFASLTFLTATLWLIRNKRPGWITAIPMVFMFGVSTWGLSSIFITAIRNGDFIRLFASTFLLLLALMLIVIATLKGKKAVQE